MSERLQRTLLEPTTTVLPGIWGVPSRMSRTTGVWTEAQIVGIREALPARYRVALVLAAGLGLRQGEVFGLAVEDIDFMRRVVHVRRQVKIVGYKMVFDMPKGKKEREVPLSEGVQFELAAHIAAWPAKTITLPWEVGTGRPTTATLLLSSRESKAINRNYFNRDIWRPARIKAGLPDTNEHGMHAGRHYYASDQLLNGTNIRALAAYLGHDDPGFTLRTYTHLVPASDDHSRKATGDLFRRLHGLDSEASGGPNVAPGPV